MPTILQQGAADSCEKEVNASPIKAVRKNFFIICPLEWALLKLTLLLPAEVKSSLFHHQALVALLESKPL